MSGASLDAAPDFVEPLEAWRVWRVVRRDGELSLASLVKQTVWPAHAPLVAECLKARSPIALVRRRPRHAAPEPRCECGVYATAFERAAEYLTDTFAETLVRVLGRVALWGTVVECERGFRASHAYPLELHVASPALAVELVRYGVPVEVLPDGRPDARAFLRAAG